MKKPTKKGQIVRLAFKLPSFRYEETYILADDCIDASDESMLTIYSITDLLRSHSKGGRPEPIKVAFKELIYVANSLEEYVDSWNYE